MTSITTTGPPPNHNPYGGGGSITSNYLKRTGTSRNSIQWLNISTSGTHKLLERYNTSRNNIRWNNLTFSFESFSDFPLATSKKMYVYVGNIYKSRENYTITSILSNGYGGLEKHGNTLVDTTSSYIEILFNSESIASKFVDFMKNNYSKYRIINLRQNYIEINNINIYILSSDNSRVLFRITESVDDFNKFIYGSGSNLSSIQFFQ